MLNGQIAVVTGASSGIGQAIALELGRRGCTVCALGRQAAALDEVVKRLSPTAPHSKAYRADLSRDDELERVALRLQQDFPDVDILVHAAGRFSTGALGSTSVDGLDAHYRINARAPYLLTQKLLPNLISARGQIVFVNSSVNPGANADLTQYAASKHALEAIADGLRAEVNAQGLRVLTLNPGRTASRMQEQVHASEGRMYRPEDLMQPHDVALMVAASLALPPSAEVTNLDMRPMIKPS